MFRFRELILTLIALAPGAVGLAGEATPAARGTLLDYSSLHSQTRKSMDLSRKLLSNKPLPPSRNAVELYRIRYATIDARGAATEASGLVIVPKEAKGPFPLVSYHHGTALNRNDVPSRAVFSVDALVGSSVFGSMGYVVAAADYLGLGDSRGLHPYLHADSEATATADMLEATRTLMAKLSVEHDGSLFLTGYSQGGHVTLALHRYLEKEGVRVTAAAPMGGPYDLSKVSLEEGISRPCALSTFYGAYLYMTMRELYSGMGNISEVMRAPYDQELPKLFTGDVPMGRVIEALPADPKHLFTQAFIERVRRDPMHEPFLQALRQNDVYDWKPRAPVLYLHAREDRHVPYGNALTAYTRMKELGAKVVLLDVGPYDHIEGALPAFAAAYRFFEAVRAYAALQR